MLQNGKTNKTEHFNLRNSNEANDSTVSWTIKKNYRMFKNNFKKGRGGGNTSKLRTQWASCPQNKMICGIIGAVMQDLKYCSFYFNP